MVENDSATSPTWQYDLHACIANMPFETFWRFFANNTSFKSDEDIMHESGDMYIPGEHDYFRVAYNNIMSDQIFLDEFNAH